MNDMLIQAIVQGLLIGATYGFVALGMGIIFSVSGVINFSHGDFLALGMFLCYALYGSFHLDPYLSMAITLPLFAIIGALLYRFLIRPIVSVHMLMIIQLTLGISFILENGLLMIFGGTSLRAPSAFESRLLFIGDSLVIRVPLVIAFLVSIFLSVMLFLILQKTDLGRSIRAVHQNVRAAALVGVNVMRTRLITFAAGIAMLAIAASLLVPGTPLTPGLGLRYTIFTLMVMVVGGMSNFVGLLLGGLIIGLAESLSLVYLSGTTGLMMPYAIFVLVLLFRPQGLMGKK